MARVYKFWLVVIFLLTAKLELYAQCTVNAYFGYSTACQGQVTHFTDSSTCNTGNSISSWLWNFGDGFTSTAQNPTHNYSATGNYNVTLTVTTVQGCSNFTTRIVVVNSVPVASFTVNNNPVNCNEEFIVFSNNSTGLNLTYLWNFGNGSTSSIEDPQHAVPPMPNSCSGFIYNTQLIVTDANGCSAATSQNITVQPRATAEIIAASDYICAISTNGQYEAEHTIFNMSTAPCLTSLLIDWGDATPLEYGDISTIDFTHTYINPGFMSLVVYGISNGGACTTVVYRDTVHIEITPTAGIIGPNASWVNGCVPFSTYFILNSDITSTTTQTVIWGEMDTVVLAPTFTKGDTVWHTFTVSGCDSLGVMNPYNVVLRAENLCGSSVTMWGDYRVHRPPIAFFNIPDTICKSDYVIFLNATNRNLCGGWTLTQFNWKIYHNGDLIYNVNQLINDNSVILPDLPFTFQDTGSYTIILTATDNGSYGCGSSQYSQTIYVQGTYANFIADTVCLGYPTTFIDSSYSVNGTITSWYWDFGDGTQSNDTNTVHTYSTAGFHNVTLIVFDSNNCSDTISKQVYVSPYPVSDFTSDTVCAGNITTFTDLSYTNAIDSIVYWQWAFGDGDTSYLQNPVHLYPQEGYYNVTLIVSTTFSCSDTLTQITYVSPYPTAHFISDTICIGETTSFTDYSFTSAIDSIILWEWDFGDGVLSNDTNPIHTFNTEGFHDVTLIVTSAIGCSDTVVIPVYVSPMPQAFFIFDTVCLGYPVTFFDATFTTAIDSAVQWLWYFGDGDSSFLENTHHFYLDTGYFSVTLISTTSFGCSDTVSQDIYVNPYPVVNFTSNQVCLGNPTQFTDQTTTSPIDHIVSWSWNFGGGNTSTLQNPSFTFPSAGYHSVTLHTVSAVGCEETVTHNAYVSPYPIANFNTFPSCIGQTHIYNNTSTTSGIHPINQWYWTFGDGGTSTAQNPGHVYPDTGVYDVGLAVSTTLGCKSDTTHKFTYVSPIPQADFIADTVCMTHATSFTDLSTTLAADSIIVWLWDFGDGASSSLQNPQHIYPDSGIFDVMLIISSSIGCRDTIIKAVYVKPMPFPEFSSVSVCVGNSTQFNDLSSQAPTDIIVNWLWQFDDGSVSSAQSPSHLYADTGTYHVQLIVTTNTGCSDSIVHTTFVSPSPHALYTVDSVCIGNATSIIEMSSSIIQDTISTWLWDFDDGTQSTLQTPIHTYSDTGHYNITLIVTSVIGCTDTLFQTTYISPFPVADFTADTACYGNATIFADLSSTMAIDSITIWSWDFGDGTTSSLQNPSHMYADTGFFTVTLVVGSSYSCSDTVMKNIYVKPLPIPDFSALSTCMGNPMSFTDLSYSSVVDTINQWLWNFGDGNQSNIQNPVYFYNDTGYFNTTLTVSSSIGCMDSVTHAVYVSPLPVTGFFTDTVCIGNSTTFTDTSYTLANDIITDWTWDFGDGSSATTQNTSHLYADTGFVTVMLVISTSIGCKDTLEKDIYVSPYPTAGFTADTACLSFPTSFTDLSTTLSALDSIIGWQWNFGDGHSSNLQNPAHIYTDSGNYIVTLIVSSAFGCSDTATQTIYVNAPPVADFNFNTVCVGNNTLFNNTSSSSVYDDIVSWQWDFGDLQSSLTENPQHFYTDSGYYTVNLIVNTLLGCSDTVAQNVYVSDYPSADFISDTVCLGNETSFSDLSFTLAVDSIINWSWDFGDGSSATLQSPTHLYADTGFASVVLIISTSIGCNDTLEQDIYVSPYPTADFTADTACLTHPTSFTDLSTTMSALDSIVLWEWDFGDGNQAQVQNPQHVYSDTGYFDVTLIVSSTFACGDTISKSIYVKPLPTPDFLTASVCLASSTIFNDLSSSSILDTVIGWLWYFGDGQTSALQHPTHLYADTGIYQVMLVATSSGSCSDSISKDVYVSPYPSANFSVDTICLGNLSSFTDLSFTLAADSIISWIWNFGDSNTSLQPSPSHSYSDTGYFDVSLIINTSIGCTDTIIKPAYVSPSPIADFTADTACFGFETHFTDMSINLAIDSIISWVWKFGDGSTFSGQNSVHTYLDTGIFQVTLICYSQIGCLDSITKDIYVKPLPYPEFSAQAVCLNEATQFNDMSVAASNDGIVGWLWQYDNTSSTLQNPSYTFADTGTYNVTLITYSLLGCSDTISHDIYVSPYPVAVFEADTVCMGHLTTFTDLSYLYNSDSLDFWYWDFGDGSISTLENPQHIYSDSGFYQVTLIISSSIGCMDTLIQNVYVSPSPIADFYAQPVCLGHATLFNDSSFTLAIDSIQSWFWDFGDGHTSNLQNPHNLYADTGYYSVSLTIESTIGCPHTVIKDVYVSPYPVANYIADTVCRYNATLFTDISYTLADDSITSWQWQFGQGQTSGLQNPSFIFADTGHFNVNIIVTSSIGCSDSIIHTVYVSPYPNADFTFDTVCLGNLTHFFDLSITPAIDSITEWVWDFGDGNSSTTQHSTHQYNNSGYYDVILITISSLGCPDTITKSVYVSPLPTAHFASDTVCIGATTHFTDLSQTTAIDSIIQWQWDFGDGNQSTLQHPENIYADTGFYDVTLIITTAIGCTDTINQSVYISPFPIVQFSFDTVCIGISTIFNDLSYTLAIDSITEWYWNFGDSTYSYVQNPLHNYADTGIYDVTLTVTTSFGCSHITNNSIYVSPYPVSDFIADTACLGSATHFTDLSYTLANDSISQWQWDFGDGNTSALQSPEHFYTIPGVYPVMLLVSSAIGCNDTVIKSIYVAPPPPAVFTADSSCFGISTDFYDLTLINQPDFITSWQWHFDDGDTSDLQNPVHLYADTGTYHVNLIISTSLGCVTDTMIDIYVKPLPYPNFEAMPVCLNEPMLFNDLSLTAANDSLVSWYWDFADGNTSSLQEPSHIYSDTGFYNVMEVVGNIMGCFDTVFRDVHVIPPPLAGFESQAVCLGEEMYFNDTSFGFTYDITGWAWDFGDGNTSAQQHPSHLYQQAGIYTVTLIAFNENDCSDTITKQLTVYELPEPDFSFADVCLNENTIFDELSTVVLNAITDWQWDFGDGNISSVQEPVHLYLSDGSYTVTLVVTDSVGCTDSISKPVTVFPLPVADFMADSICSGDTAYFNDISTTISGSINTWQWIFGNGTGTALTQNPTYLYDTVSNIVDYDVTLIVSNTYGCYDTINKTLRENPLPVPNFTTDTACFGNESVFTDLSYSNGGALQSWFWDFGDGIGYDSVSNPQYIYTNHGFYQAELQLIDIKGCSNYITQTVFVDSLPMPSFDWCQVCMSGTLLPVTFTNTSQGNGSTIVSNAWSFGNGQTSYFNGSVTSNYDTAGTYNVTLITTNDRGCSDSISTPINVHSGLSIDFTSQVNCFDVNFIATSNNSTSLIEWEWNFGDGSYSNAHDSASHTYYQPGTYQITLTVYDSLPCLNLLCSQSVTNYIYLYPPPIANFTAPNVSVGMSTPFTDLSTAPLSTVVDWYWDFGDGSSSAFQNPVHTYLQYGVYDVTLTITNSFGCSQSITQQVIVYPAVIAEFDSASVCANTPLTFNNTTQILMPNLPVNWLWDFGDGMSSVDSLPTHTYYLPGIYTVTLIVSVSSNIADTAIQQITVFETPVADFTFTEVCEGDTLTTLTDNSFSSIPIIKWSWDLGDSTTAFQPLVNHFYLNHGSYSVTLIVQNSYGCVDTVTKTVRVFDKPDIIIDATPKFGCEPLAVSFSDFSTVDDAGIINWLWHFGDGFGSMGFPNVIHTYNGQGLYDITLTLTTNQGCQNSMVFPSYIQVFPKPFADFGYSPTVPFSTDMVQFHNFSAGSVYWEWNFGDSITSHLMNPTHIFDEGTFLTMLVAYNEYYCSDTAFSSIYIRPSTVIYIPNTFSPLNNDGLNDMFMVKGVNINNLEMRIFNRYGEMIFYTDDVNRGWDGRFEGNIVPLGVYVWKIWYKDAYGYHQEKYGTVTVLY